MTTQNDMNIPSGNASVEIYVNNVLKFTHSMTKITSRCFWFDKSNLTYTIDPNPPDPLNPLYWNYLATPYDQFKIKIKWPFMSTSPGWTNFIATIDSQIGQQ